MCLTADGKPDNQDPSLLHISRFLRFHFFPRTTHSAVNGVARKRVRSHCSKHRTNPLHRLSVPQEEDSTFKINTELLFPWTCQTERFSTCPEDSLAVRESCGGWFVIKTVKSLTSVIATRNRSRPSWRRSSDSYVRYVGCATASKIFVPVLPSPKC